MTRLKQCSLAEQVHQKLTEMIVRGRRAEGEKLSEESVCAEFGVSRSPAREALMMLARDGLVERLPRRGCFVKRPDAQETAELYVCRRVVELAALELGFAALPQGKLKKLLAALEIATASLDVDEELHSLILESCPNRHLREIGLGLLRRTRPYRACRAAEPDGASRGRDERQAILRALLGGDKAEAAKLLADHLLQGSAVVG